MLYFLNLLSFAVGLKICAITSGIKNYKSIIKKKKKKHDQIVLLGKTKLDTIEVLISKSLIDSYIYISHGEFVSVNNVLREYNDMKEQTKKSGSFCRTHYIKTMKTYCVSCKKNTANENSSVRITKQNRLMLLSNCTVCGKKKSTFIKNKELYNFNNI